MEAANNHLKPQESAIHGIQQTEDTIDLIQLISVLWGKAVWIILSAVFFACVFGAYNRYMVTPTYSAEAKIYVAGSDSIINLQQIQLNSALTQDYASIMKSRTVLKKVIADQKLDMSYQTLSGMVTITNPQDTHILKLTVTTDEPELSIRIANSFLKYSIDSIFKTVGNDEPSIIDFAEADAITVNKTSLIKHAFIGAVLGGMLVCGIVVFMFLLDNSVHNEDDVRSLGLTVLAEIPVYDDEDEKKGRTKHGSK